MAKTPAKNGSTKANGAAVASTDEQVAVMAICTRHNNKPDELLEILHDLVHEQGFVSEAAIPVIANALNLSRAEVHGVVTFYHDFRREPAGKHVVKICRAEACQSMGTDALCRHAEQKLKAKMGDTSPDGLFTVEQVFCLGNCALSPAVMIDDKLYGKVDPKRFDEIVAHLGKETQ